MEEKENVTPETDAIDNDWDDIDLSDVTDDGTEEETETETEEEADHSEESKDEEKPAETETKDESKEDADQRFTLKHLDEVKEYSREEVVTLAQKGLDYDRIRQKLSEKETAEKQNKDVIAFVDELAKEQNLSTAEFMLGYRAATMARKDNISIDDAKKRLQMQAKEKELDEREKALNEKVNEQAAEQTKREKAQNEFKEFFKARPEVKADDIPKEVFQQAMNGVPLLTAYTAWENAQLRAQLEAEKKNRENAERATGSTSSAGKKVKKDTFDDLWYDGT